MSTTEKTIVTVSAKVHVPLFIAWKVWTEPHHIMMWNNASPDWHTPAATNDLREGGRFNYRMEARDGSFGFDFEGTYNLVAPFSKISYTMDDGRKVFISFNRDGEYTSITETFDAETMNPVDLQRTGWQAILDNFGKYAEQVREKEKLRFGITFNAPVEKVCSIMLDDATYREWTSVFNPTSCYKGSWDQGSKILFVGSDENGKEGGMVSRIAEHIPHQYLSIEHIGLYGDGQEITEGDEVAPWAGSRENYTWKQDGNQTHLEVDIDTNDDYRGYFEGVWPQALEKLKQMVEKR